MNARDMHDLTAAREARRQRLAQQMETRRWVYHAADLSTGNVQTDVLNGPLTPAARVEHLARLGIPADISIFGGPSYQLTPRRPYQAQPEAWLIASVPGDYSTLEDMMLWQLPRDQSSVPFQQLQCHFDVSPDHRSLVSIVLSASSWAGRAGSVMVVVADHIGQVLIPIDETSAQHTVDVAFDPTPHRPTDVFMMPEPGIELLLFRSMTLRALPPVAEPGP